ncbi:hypothetical protein [Mycolicibacter heraklionensis]|uniref:hypothetical protein n=1 Tax=Mycolicibacter heraklionensis TaxID=512402 RepID=UPI0007EFB648|nr:hypothetical protein [Mycolicibacter heraklionensis]OBJ31240.1 hypothetical protein A5631_12605 [Mycolicibacter heraklionensis]
MAQRYDVSTRLAEGREAVMHTQTYVSACYRRGYRHPELTGYDGQLAGRYDSEAGLDLQSLDSDCAALNALADTADDALRIQRQQLVELANAWRGPGADVAAEFLRQHCDAAAQLTTRLRAAAAGCGVLRDELWRLVDAKVAAMVAVDERVGAHRHSWLAAAHAVSSGAGEEGAAEVVDKQVIPYVDNDVRGEWVTAIRTAQDGIAAAYGAAIAAAEPGAGVVFAIPGDLGPVHRPEVAAPAVPVPIAPIAGPLDVPPAQTAQVAPDPPAQTMHNAAPAQPLDDQPGGLASLDEGEAKLEPPHKPGGLASLDEGEAKLEPPHKPGDLGLPGALGLPGDLGMPSAGLPGGLGGGLGGLAGLGGLIPRLVDALGDPGAGQAFDEPFDDPIREGVEPTDSDDPEPESEPETEPAVETAKHSDAEDPAGDAAIGDVAVEPAPGAGDSGPVVDTGDSADEPAAESTDVIPPKTPCEMAAEELPQVGE